MLLNSVTQHRTARNPAYATYLAQALLFVTVGPDEDRQSFLIVRYLSEEPVSMFNTGDNDAATLADDTNELPARLFKFSAAPTLRGYHVEAMSLSSIQGRACVIRKPARSTPASSEALDQDREGRDGRDWVLWAALPASLSAGYFHWLW